MGPIPLGTPQWHAADAANLARGAAHHHRLWRASGYGAIAYSPTTGRYGYSWSYHSRAEAERTALRHTQSTDAVVWFGHHTYIALARSGGGSYGFAWNADARVALDKAVQICRTDGGRDIHVDVVVDTTRGPLA